MLSRKLFSVFTAATIGGGALVAPANATPLAHASEVTAAQTSPEIAERQLFAYPSLYLLQGDTDTFTPLSDDLPPGITLTLEEGAALEELRADGWSISATDNILTVAAPRHAEGDYQIPVIVTFPDQSTQTTAVTMSVDYLADIPLSILIPATVYVQLSESSMSSTWP